jgi:hypothetical protein
MPVVVGPGGVIYVLGGFGDDGLTASTLVYDGAWSEGPAMPTARRGSCAAVDADGNVHVLGGWGDGAPREEHEVLDTREMTWSTAMAIPAPGWEAACATGPDGRIHVVGGESRGARHDAWDPATGEWVQLDELPEARIQHDAFFGPDGRLYVVGGGVRNELRNDVLVWERSFGWSRREGPPVPVRQAAAVWLGDGGGFALIGGSTAYNNNVSPYFDAVQLYDAANDRWRAGPALPAGVRELGAVFFGGELYAVGGRRGDFAGEHLVAAFDDLAGPPVLDVEFPETLVEGTTIQIVAMVDDLEEDPVSVTWEVDGVLSSGPIVVLRAVDDGEISVSVEARDGFGASVRMEAVIPVENVAPRFVEQPGYSARPGFLYRFDARAVDPAGPFDPVRVVLIQGPEGMTLDGHRLTWTPATEGISAEVVLVADDGDGGTSELRWTIEVDADADGDGVIDEIDNCPTDANPTQSDLDGDLMGDVCDDDDDSDGVPDVDDNCPGLAEQSGDLDGDGRGDLCDADDDNDGLTDPVDETPSGGKGSYEEPAPPAVVADDGCGIAASEVRRFRFLYRR